MSIVIASKFKNGILLASDRQVTYYGSKVEDQANKIKKIEDQPLLIGGVGYLRELQQIFSISKEWFSDFGIKQLTNDVCISYINKLTSIFREKQFIQENQIVGGLNGRFLIMDPYNINVISQDLSVMSNFDYFAIGCGSDLVMGHLNVIFSNKKPEEISKSQIDKILTECIELACKDDVAIDNNIDKIAIYKKAQDLVDDDNYEVINKCEYDILDKQRPKSKSECNNKCDECIHNIRFIYSKQEKTIKMISN